MGGLYKKFYLIESKTTQTMHYAIEQHLRKKMTRKEFLKNIGFMLLAVIGLGRFLQYLTQGEFTSQKQTTSNGYGASTFGGLGRDNLKRVRSR